MFINNEVAFTVELKPIQAVNREIHFEIKDLKPVNFEFINKKIFNKPPFLKYENENVIIDFNGWDIVKKIPVGKIKEFKLYNGQIGQIELVIGV